MKFENNNPSINLPTMSIARCNDYFISGMRKGHQCDVMTIYKDGKCKQHYAKYLLLQQESKSNNITVVNNNTTILNFINNFVINVHNFEMGSTNKNIIRQRRQIRNNIKHVNIEKYRTTRHKIIIFARDNARNKIVQSHRVKNMNESGRYYLAH